MKLDSAIQWSGILYLFSIFYIFYIADACTENWVIGPIGRDFSAGEPVAAEPVAAEPVASRTVGQRTISPENH